MGVKSYWSRSGVRGTAGGDQWPLRHYYMATGASGTLWSQVYCLRDGEPEEL